MLTLFARYILVYGLLMMELNEKQFELIRDLLPVQRGNVRISNLDVINAILYVAESGCTWRALPPRFGRWHTIYTRLRRWTDAGVLDRVFQALQEHHLIRIRIEYVGSENSTNVHSAGSGAAETSKFFWLPRLSEQP